MQNRCLAQFGFAEILTYISQSMGFAMYQQVLLLVSNLINPHRNVQMLSFISITVLQLTAGLQTKVGFCKACSDLDLQHVQVKRTGLKSESFR